MGRRDASSKDRTEKVLGPEGEEPKSSMTLYAFCTKHFIQLFGTDKCSIVCNLIFIQLFTLFSFIMNIFFNNLEECQKNGCHFDAKNNDQFEHLAYHRQLLLDHYGNIAHEIALAGREMIDKDIGTQVPTNLSQQNITLQQQPVSDGILDYPDQQDVFGNESPMDCCISVFCSKNVGIHSQKGLHAQANLLLGGMNSNMSVPHGNISLTTYAGMRFSNPQNDCYLNSAVNNILTNLSMRQEILNPNLPHSNSQQPVINELRKLLSATDSVKSVRPLKEALKQCYPQSAIYSNEAQHDAGEAFFNILHFLPRIEDRFRIMIKIQRTCSNPSCQHKNEILEDENITFLL